MSRSNLVARNILVTLATQLALWALSFGVTLYLPGYLKDSGLGTMTLVGSYATILSVMVSLGTSKFLIKEIARDRSRTGELLAACLVMRLVLGLLALLVGWLGTRLMNYTASLQLFIMIALVVMVIAQLGEVMTSGLAGLEEFPKQNASLLMERVVSSTLIILLVLLRQPLWTFIAISSIGAISSLGYSAYLLRRYLASVSRPRWSTIKSIAQASVPFLMAGLFVCVYGESDALLLSKISGVAAIGWYSLAKRLAGSTMIIPVALCSTMLPTLSRKYLEDPSAFIGNVQRLIRLMILCVTPISAVLILAPGQILAMLHYPPGYRHSIPVLILMGSAIILWYLSQAVGTALIACDRQSVFSKITGIAAIVSVPLCAACILTTQRIMTNGAIGAMLSDVLLELFMVTAYIRALPKDVFGWQTISILTRTSVAALPFALSLYAMSSRHDLVWPIVGLLLYPVGCYLLRCLCPADLQMLQQFGRRFSRA